MALAPRWIEDPLTGLEAELTVVQPYQAHKWYRCPGCNGDIAPGTGHLVVVPTDANDLRRHWHRSCLDWELRHGQRRRHRRT